MIPIIAPPMQRDRISFWLVSKQMIEIDINHMIEYILGFTNIVIIGGSH
jgi:hypothetical protein